MSDETVYPLADADERFSKRGLLPPDTTSHKKGFCQCVRCTGFQPGHKYSAGENHRGGMPIKHGAYSSPMRLKPDAEKIAEEVRPLLPMGNHAFEGIFQSYCILLVRIQRAYDALEKVESDQWDMEEKPISTMALEENLRRWISSASKLANDLGLTPRSFAAILKDTKEGMLADTQSRVLTEKELSPLSADKLRLLRDNMREILATEDFIDAED